MPNTLLTSMEPAKKRSKLVLPEPQVSEQDMQQVIKLGKATDSAKEVVSENRRPVGRLQFGATNYGHTTNTSCSHRSDNARGTSDYSIDTR